MSPAFTYVALFEMRKARAAQLRDLRDSYPNRRIDVFEGDCDELMKDALHRTPVPAPTFAFLDPDGMELEWRTVQLRADHKRARTTHLCRVQRER